MEDSSWEAHVSPMMMGGGHPMGDMGGHQGDLGELAMGGHHQDMEDIRQHDLGHSMDGSGDYYAHQLLVSGQPTAAAAGSSPGSGGGSLSPGGGTLSPGVAGGSGAPGAAAPCCDSGRPLATDPVTGQSVCSCQYDPARLSALQYSRGVGVYGAPYPGTDQNPYQSIGVESSAFYSPLSNPYGLKDASGTDMSAWTSAGLQPTTGYYPYDPTLAAYGYGAGYDLAARRKNATRESTATLKAWLNEHKKNPYPTKGEKIMLAIITKMTLTQVSTWFANARRRLKKENKMTWEPKNKTDDDDDALVSDGDEKDKEDDDKRDDTDIHDRVKSERALDPSPPSPDSGDRKDDILGAAGVRHLLGGTSSPSAPFSLKTEPKADCGVPLPPSKPKIWSLADTAACKTPPPPPPHQWGNSGFALPSSRYGSGGLAGFPCQGGFPDLQADTPPQTPPNLKLPSAVAQQQQQQASCLGYGQGQGFLGSFAARMGEHRQGQQGDAGNNNGAAAFKPFYKSSQSINGGFVSPV